MDSPERDAIAALIAGHNSAAAGGLRLELRGARIGLRGPLPCRHGGPGRPVQRLSLGLPASPAGLEQALRRRRELEQQLRRGSFRWPEQPSSRASGASGAGPTAVSGPGTAGSVSSAAAPGGSAAAAAPGPAAASGAAGLDASLAAFEQAFFSDPRRRRRPAGSRSTWTAAYRPYLRRLRRIAAEAPAGTRLSEPLLLQVLESYPLASRSRQQCAVSLAAFARHAGLALPPDWSERGAGYGLHAARFRQLPGDGAILELVERIPNPAWRLVYGLMATYGLRNHEVFFCDLSALGPGGDRVIRVLPTSKTGEHQVWPFQPDWVEQFGLSRLAGERAALPPVCTDLRHTTLQQVGRRVAEQFRRYALPITPYDLRHAWAVRTIHIGLPDTVAARMMGHSVAIHTRTYHHWITRRDQQRAVDAALARLGPSAGHSGDAAAISA